MKIAITIGIVAILGFSLFTLNGRDVVVPYDSNPALHATVGEASAEEETTFPDPPKDESRDISKQLPLLNPPQEIKGIYLTGWSAGSKNRMEKVMKLIDETELNAVVIDIKDYSGYVSYKTGIPEVEAAGAEGELRILAPNQLIKDLHDRGIYVIGRISVFEDTILAKARPEWAVKNKATGRAWADRKGLLWLDPAEKRVWDYHVAIAKDALGRGFDEVNFDYIRFPSDGDLDSMEFPAWDRTKLKSEVLQEFFEHLRKELPGAKISGDIFGLVTVERNDLGIGQIIEKAYPYFDAVAPMVYPSHYASGFLGYKNPAEHPYEVVKYSLEQALGRLQALMNETSSVQFAGRLSQARIRPWLQDFDLGADYDVAKVKDQIRAVSDALLSATGTIAYNGWLMWAPSNTYTIDAFLPAE